MFEPTVSLAVKEALLSKEFEVDSFSVLITAKLYADSNASREIYHGVPVEYILFNKYYNWFISGVLCNLIGAEKIFIRDMKEFDFVLNVVLGRSKMYLLYSPERPSICL